MNRHWNGLWKWTLALSALVALTGATLWALERSWLEVLCREDGVVEYGTSGLYFAAAGLFLAVARTADGWRKLWGAGLALVSFFVAGEEISWGQRLIGLTTPEGLAQVNVQNEFNLHNIDGFHQNVRALGLLFVLVTCYAIPIAYRLWAQARAQADRLQLPVFPLFAAPTVTMAVAYMVAPRLSGRVVFELDELGELLLAMGFFAFALAARLRPRPAAAAASLVPAMAVAPRSPR